MIARVVRAFLLVTAMLMHLAVPAHDGEHADDGSYLSHLPYDEVSADRLTLFRGMPVYREAVPMLRRMWRDTAKDDVFLVMTSGFRTIEQQARLFYRDASARSLEEIARTVCPSGPQRAPHRSGLRFRTMAAIPRTSIKASNTRKRGGGCSKTPIAMGFTFHFPGTIFGIFRMSLGTTS